MSGKGNEGLIISGGSVTAGALAVGREASAVQHTNAGFDQSQLTELNSLLKQLQQGIELHKEKIKDSAEAQQAVELIRNEVKQVQPNRLTVRSVMTGLKESIHAIAELKPLVEAAGQIIGHLLG
jgi:hypothetical protein